MNEPYIIETFGRSTKTIDIRTKLLQDRIIYLNGEITPDVANSIITQLMWLNADNSSEDINLYINSPGGSVYDGFGIKDIMNIIDAPVNTIGIGICASMGAYLLASGTGTRKATENCRIMLHSVSSTADGSFHDIKSNYKETEFLQEKMLKDIANFSKNSITFELLKDMTNHDFYMSSKDAVKCGLIDKII